MISDFVYKYYIDPIRYGEAYTLVDTLTYALILIISVYFVYRWLQRTGIEINSAFVLATIPYVVLGGLLRVVNDTGIIDSDFRFILVTPIIFFFVFFITVISLLISRLLENVHTVNTYLIPYRMLPQSYFSLSFSSQLSLF